MDDRTSRKLVVLPAFFLLAFGSLANMGFLASANVASFSPPDPRISIPPPPNIIGCYQYLNISKSWMGTPCLSPSEANSITRPTEGGSATSNPIYGISVSSNVADFGYVWVD
ncbi:MAG: hypothetical protein JRM80_04670, partial [Nitrososphaerota archaeon]|nr:hypothetical protein [Nitrososphaerota archaeon]